VRVLFFFEFHVSKLRRNPMRKRTAPAAPYVSAFFLKRFFGGYTPGIHMASKFLNMAKKRNVLPINIIKMNFPISSPLFANYDAGSGCASSTNALWFNSCILGK
jgi:hypothetical protein